ncbi:pyridoxal phosphate-dependent aminotransferase [Streptomyces albus]|nr:MULTISPECIES: histidinol-phosphate transaminase [Streptomyces]KPC94819.1 histidinol-phosphate aminotransferase [Streptomyces sp. NRRL F-6602]EPD96973.1 histidinol-phosphate transaminase [Streptomyces sp. HPH0547]MDI6410269.1 histidinol-phosphate transaminase [Streptomyces albus]QID34735.1 histidinol-phosphate aminotransferase family protein [Streptomyces albus]TGG74786.1 histidinol-phosphate aminotransferase family protein [Streptomyces albus]
MTAPVRQETRNYNASVPSADDLVRLHLSESPYGASPAAVAAVTGELERINRYPAPGREGLVQALARHWELPEEHIAVANGSDELVLATALTLGDPGSPGLVTAGTFPGYLAALERIGRGAVQVPLAGSGTDTAAFADRLPGCGIGYVCNPHNPCGSALTHDELHRLVAAARDSGTPLVFDEAYHEFGPPAQPQARTHLREDTPVLALRTFSKAYGLAALRIGYALGPADLIAEVRRTLTVLPFSVNRAAQAAALAALDDQEFLGSVRRDSAARRQWFCAELERRGYRYLPSVTNFVAVEVAASAEAQDVLARDHGILVRDTGMFGFPGHLRVSLGSVEELRGFLDALDRVTAGSR